MQVICFSRYIWWQKESILKVLGINLASITHHINAIKFRRWLKIISQKQIDSNCNCELWTSDKLDIIYYMIQLYSHYSCYQNYKSTFSSSFIFIFPCLRTKDVMAKTIIGPFYVLQVVLCEWKPLFLWFEEIPNDLFILSCKDLLLI